ncbi:MAG: aspartate-semialdehyde dehydrogenase [Nitrosopumilus sp.]|nr:aspartate-semialdehyde dehydrogenase [Nitrosopumilus sp.]MDA7954667.1 aspartate-semialdehyde dehydrogenase [Nitrosopumilus sp.]
MERKRVAVVGATGSVGQEFIQSLEGHPWFEVDQLAASERSAGKRYVDALRGPDGMIKWDAGGQVPAYAEGIQVRRIDELDTSRLDLAFSAVESEAARSIETGLAAEVPVISTSSAYRYEEDVPILIPGINDEQAGLLDVQSQRRGWKGWVAPLPNCTTTGLAITLKPLVEKYGARRVIMTSLQAISGGGRSGVAAMGITDNVLPYIANEERKVMVETRKILGSLEGGRIRDADVRVSCTCTRVPVIDGHTESVSVETEKKIGPDDARRLYEEANSGISVAGLPSAPEKYYAFHEDPTRPQPRMERDVGGGMTTTIGRAEEMDLFGNGLKYVLFSHNKKMGSAKGAVLLAEMLCSKGKI